ncbi:MAG TPA: hypothetical protein VNL94_08750 [Candidatus Binatia bacterium]|nr:hypothetical protein [Candidatus Binatia bacterium]
MTTGPGPGTEPAAALFERLRGNRTRLVLTSGTLLFVELLLIRWIPSEVRYIGFFSNFLLMASFLGIGIGILLGRRRNLDTIAIFPVLLAVVVVLITQLELNVQIDSTDELFFGLAENRAADVNFLVLPLVFALVTALMATLAIPLGPLLRSMPPLQAYGWDIVGSMLGIAGFTALSAAGTPPILWFTVATILVALLLGGTPSGGLLIRLPAVAALAIVLIVTYRATTGTEIWSPYYRINMYYTRTNELFVNVNGIPHQALHRLDAPKEPFYDQLYKWFPDRRYEEVLIIGAGSGTDVAIALANGAGHVDAVEIDRAIQKLGIDNHPDRPYQDPRVTRYENDGRAFLRGTDKQYDLVIFALPDSLTLVSTTANIRLESFLFTQQAFEAVRDHLAPDGVFVLYNYYREPWLISKIGSMLDETFDSPPIYREYSARMAIFAVGPLIDALNGATAGGRGPAAAGGRRADPDARDRRLAVPVPPDAVRRVALPRGPGVRAADRGHRRPRRRARRRHAGPPLQPALLRARHRVPAARDAVAGQLRAAVRLDVAGQRAGLLRDPRLGAARDPGERETPDPPARAALRRAVRRAGRGLRPAAGIPADRPAVAPVHARGDRGVRACVPREPRLHLLVPGHEDG